MPLTKEEVLEKMKDPAVVLLNVLPEKEYDKLHIKDSKCLALGQNIRGFEAEAMRKFGKQTFLITYGADSAGTLGLNAAKLLVGKGFKADNFPGGLKEWTQAGWPTSTTEAPASKPQPAQLKRKGKK